MPFWCAAQSTKSIILPAAMVAARRSATRVTEQGIGQTWSIREWSSLEVFPHPLQWAPGISDIAVVTTVNDREMSMDIPTLIFTSSVLRIEPCGKRPLCQGEGCVDVARRVDHCCCCPMSQPSNFLLWAIPAVPESC